MRETEPVHHVVRATGEWHAIRSHHRRCRGHCHSHHLEVATKALARAMSLGPASLLRPLCGSHAAGVWIGGQSQMSHGKRGQDPTSIIAKAWAWTITIAFLVADWLIWIMLRTRSNERRIRPTRRVSWPKGLKRDLMRQQNNTCVYCGTRRTARTLDIDHMIPAVRGGSNSPNNLQVICRPCNQRKGMQTDQEFRARYSRLVPAAPLTPPYIRVSQREFREETQRTNQSSTVREFRRTRFITAREKILSGCGILGLGVGVLALFGLAYIGAEGMLLLLPAVGLGVAVGFGVLLRAYMTGATSEDDEEDIEESP